MSQPVPEKYKALQKEWKYKEKLWLAMHYGLGVTSAVLAALTGLKSRPDFLAPMDQGSLAIAAAVLAAVLTVLSPASRRKAYTEACDLLRVTRFSFEHEHGIPVSRLSDAIKEAQNCIRRN